MRIDRSMALGTLLMTWLVAASFTLGGADVAPAPEPPSAPESQETPVPVDLAGEASSEERIQNSTLGQLLLSGLQWQQLNYQ